MNPSDWWGHGFGLMWLIPLLFIAVFLFFMRGMFGQGRGSGQSTGPKPESAREILDKRFAKSEISKDEYEEMKRALGNSSQ
jgi:putative membrane protein